jgi:hypothetical protein
LRFLEADLVLSLLACPENEPPKLYDAYEELLIKWASHGLRYVSLVALPYERARFYHIYLSDQSLNRYFIEAPLIHDSKMIISYENHSFFESVQPFFEDLVGEQNIINKSWTFFLFELLYSWSNL